MGYDYAGFVTALSVETDIPQTDAGFIAILPTIIGQAEGMIYREPGLEFLSTIVTDDSGFATAGSQSFTLPRFFVVLHDINLVQGNDRPPLVKVSRETLNLLYPRRIANAISDVPVKWAPDTDQTVLLAPTPGSAYQLECVGEAPPTPLSAVNTTTWLWSNLGDLAFAAAMVFISGYMRNFGSQADDPKMAQSWQGVYAALLPGAKSQEMRRKYQATGGGA